MHILSAGHAARTMAAPSLRASVEYQDLVAYGMFGLIDAMERFDLSAGTKFFTFASYRIRGAITDEMRDQAWEPRSVRARSRMVAQAASDLELKLGRPATEVELAAHVDMSVADLRRVATDVASSRVTSLTAAVNEDGFTLADTVVSHTDETILHPEVSEAAGLVAAAMEMLPENDRILIALIYVKGMALKEIAKLLDVTESWVSLLHTRAMVALQRTLAAAY